MSISKKAVDRFVKELGGFQKILQAAKNRDINESDTVAIVTDILSNIFGFDKYLEVTSELCIRGTYCDLAIKVDGKLQYLIEVKAIGLALKDNHLRQVINYGANEGIQWVVLTNGVSWEIYRIKFEKPIDYEQVCVFDLLEMNARKGEDQEKLFLLAKEGLGKAAMDGFHERMQSINRFMLGALALSEPVISAMRRELRRIAPGLKVENGEIEKILKTEVLKREVLEGDPATKAKARLKKANSKPGTKKHQHEHAENVPLSAKS